MFDERSDRKGCYYNHGKSYPPEDFKLRVVVTIEAVVPENIYEEHRSSIDIDVFEVNEYCKIKRSGHDIVLHDSDDGQKEDTYQDPIVLKVNVIEEDESWRKDQEQDLHESGFKPTKFIFQTLQRLLRIILTNTIIIFRCNSRKSEEASLNIEVVVF